VLFRSPCKILSNIRRNPKQNGNALEDKITNND